MRVPKSAFRVALSIGLTALPIFPEAVCAAPADRQPEAGAASADRKPPGRQELLRQAAGKFHQGDKEGAEALFKEILRGDPQNTDANFSLGAIAEERGDLSAALKFYEAAATGNPGDKEAAEAFAALKERIAQQKAAPQQSTFREPALLTGRVNSSGKNDYLRLGLAAREEGKNDEAIAFFQKALQQNPHELKAMVTMGEIYSQHGQHVPALACYQMALRENPFNQDLRAAADLESAKTNLHAAAQRSTPGRETTRVAVGEQARSSTSGAIINVCSQVLRTAVVGHCTPSRFGYHLFNPSFFH